MPLGPAILERPVGCETLLGAVEEAGMGKKPLLNDPLCLKPDLLEIPGQGQSSPNVVPVVPLAPIMLTTTVPAGEEGLEELL